MNELKLNSEEIREIAAKAYADPVFFLKFFLSSKFSKEIPWLHRGCLAILTRKTEFLKKYGELDKIVKNFMYRSDPNDEKSPLLPIFRIDEDGNIQLAVGKFTLLMLPRGFSKTTLAGQGVILYWICYRERKFPVYISETQTHAEMQVANIARELEANPRILAVFGNLVPERSTRLKWTADIIQTTTGVTVCARGRGTQVRGLNVDGARPDVLLLDDVEDRESVKTTEQRQKTRTWAYGDVIPALPEMDESATIIALGTLLHPEALLMTWVRDGDWTSIVFGVRDVDGMPLWDDNMSEGKILKKKAMFARAGQLGQYYLEYENCVRNEETAKFRNSFFIYSPITRDKLVGVGIALDPAISIDANACYAAIGVAGMSENGLIHALEMWGKIGASPNEQLEKFFELHLLWDCSLAGIESNAFQASLIHTAREWMFRKRRYFEIKPLTHTTKKEERVEGILQTRYAAGYMRHQRRFPELEEQLLDWPNGKKDFPDVLAMAVSLLDPHAPQAAMNDNVDLGKDEYPPLDEVFEGEWRRY